VNRLLLHPATRPCVFVIAALPFSWLAFAALTDPSAHLGANPAERLIRDSGEWALRFLCLALAVTPLRRWTGWHALARLRRMLGLYAFFYAGVHFLCYAALDMGLDIATIVKDIAKRPFILVGMVAFGLLLPLAATSLNRAVKALGAVRWRILHKAVFGIAVLALLHFYWMRSAKNDVAEVVVYALVLGFLVGWRVRHAWQDQREGVIN
jgi:sulfoxide reductase heme-binding subunit YedZ